MSFIYKYKTSTLTPFVKCCAILNIAAQTILCVGTICHRYNLDVVLLIGSAKSYNYKYRTLKIDQKIFTHNPLMAYVESTTIMYNPGSTKLEISHTMILPLW